MNQLRLCSLRRRLVPNALCVPDWLNSQGRPTPRLYFYVPHDIERLAVYARYTAAGPPKFFAPDGTEVTPKFVDDQRLILIDVAASQRGQVWSLDKAKCPIDHLHMLNVPGSFAFSAEALLVPDDALPNAQEPKSDKQPSSPNE